MIGFWDQIVDEEEGEETGAEGAEAAPDDDSEEDAAFRDAMEMADAVKGGWGAREQLEACLAVAEAALLSKTAKAQRREQAEEHRRRESRERAMATRREREEREAREIVVARER